MTLSYSVVTKDGPEKKTIIDVVRVEPGPRGVSVWRKYGEKELMYYLSFASGASRVCISQ